VVGHHTQRERMGAALLLRFRRETQRTVDIFLGGPAEAERTLARRRAPARSQIDGASAYGATWQANQ